MAARSRPSSVKRQRERDKKARRILKDERRKQRRAQRAEQSSGTNGEAPVMPDGSAEPEAQVLPDPVEIA